MKLIDLFCQGEGVDEIVHIELASDATFAFLKAQLMDKFQIPEDVLLFIEDHEDPIDESLLVKDFATATGLKVHFHRCRHIKVVVMFNGKTVECHFPPSATVARVKVWGS